MIFIVVNVVGQSKEGMDDLLRHTGLQLMLCELPARVRKSEVVAMHHP